MEVFRGGPPAQALGWAVQRILARRDELGLPRGGDTRWSIAELRLDDEDYAWLAKAFGASGKESFVHQMRQVARHRGGSLFCVQGLLLLTLVSECARREATEESLWPVITGQSFWNWKRSFADQNGKDLKDYIHAAAKHYRLRYCEAGGYQHYRNTILLQIAFTKDGCRERLLEWVQGRGIYSVEAMVGLEGDRANRSASLVELVRALRHGIANRWTDQMVRKELESSPWLKPDWVEPLLASMAEAKRRDIRLELDEELDREAVPDLVGEPWLEWSRDEPRVTLKVAERDQWPEQYQAGMYSLLVGGETFRLVRREAGGYGLDPKVDTISLSLDDLPGQFQAEVVAPDTGSLRERFGPWKFWEPERVVNLWEYRGRPWEPATPLDVNREYILWVADGYQVTPEPADWVWAGDGQCYRLGPGESRGLRVETEDGELVWRPDQEIVRPHQTWWDGVTATVAEAVRFGETPRIEVAVPEGYGIEWVKVEQRPKEIRRDRPGRLEVTGERVVARPGTLHQTVRVGVVDVPRPAGTARAYTRPVKVRLPLAGEVVVWPAGDGKDDEATGEGVRWQDLAAEPEIFVENNSRPPILRFFRPAEAGFVLWAGKDPLGYVFLRRGQGQLKLSRRPAGLGEPLRLWGGRGGEQVLGRFVRSRPFTSAVWDGQTLSIPWDSEPTDEHQIVCWIRDGQVVSSDPLVDGGHWLAEVPDGGDLWAAAITFRGARMRGTTWSAPDWPEALRAPTDLWLALWFCLPLLAKAPRGRLRRLVGNQQIELYCGWLDEPALPAGLAWPEDRSAVSGALQQLGIRPPEACDLDKLTQLLDSPSAGRTLARLLEEDPEMVFDALQQWVFEKGLPDSDLVTVAQRVSQAVADTKDMVLPEWFESLQQAATARQVWLNEIVGSEEG